MVSNLNQKSCINKFPVLLTNVFDGRKDARFVVCSLWFEVEPLRVSNNRENIILVVLQLQATNYKPQTILEIFWEEKS